MNSLDFLDQPSEVVAQLLLGCELERRLDGQTVRVKIVETEGYSENDAASHSYKGVTKRTSIMFGKSGYLYVYFTYGMHYCANIVTGKEGDGSAVLIRAVEPLLNTNALLLRRPGMTGVNLTNGPAKLCQAMGIDKSLNGHDLKQKPLILIPREALDAKQIVQTTRIGVTKDADLPLRFYIKNNPYVSRVI